MTRPEKPAGATSALTADERVKLHELIGDIERETSAEICVMLVKESRDPVALASQYFAHLGIGKKDLDNGVLILVVLAIHDIEVLIGRGLREALPQQVLDRVVNEILSPHFREERFGTGLLLGVETLGRTLRQALPLARRGEPGRIPDVIELESRDPHD